MKFQIISHVTTLCNYDCSYCDVIKDKKFITHEQRDNIIAFIEKNHKYIQRYKFFGWEPLLAFKDIKYIIDSTYQYLWENYEIVTNTTVLNPEIWEYLTQYFSHIFFSIDSENEFEYIRVIKFVEDYRLEDKLYFNLIISPGKTDFALKQFKTLYAKGMRWFNILPVYFTQAWTKTDLENLSIMMKHILDLSMSDSTLRLYGFKENKWYDTSLANNTIFIDIDASVYYSDMTSTFSWKKHKDWLFLWEIDAIDLWDFIWENFLKQKSIINSIEEEIYRTVPWQRYLHKIMDYFSKYLSRDYDSR